MLRYLSIRTKGYSSNFSRALLLRISIVFVFISALSIPFEQMALAVERIKIKNQNQHHRSSTVGHLEQVKQAASDRQMPVAQGSATLKQSFTSAENRKEIVSNANNFHGNWQSDVNLRTGMPSFTMLIDDFLYNLGQNKKKLTLAYAGTTLPGHIDTFDLGPNWRWNIGVENPSSSRVPGHTVTDIITGSGHALTMISDHDTRGKIIWHPLRYKLQDVTITGHPGDWLVSESAGVRERILDGYAIWQQSRDGHRIYFYYNRHGAGEASRHLTYVCAHELTPDEQRGKSNACKNDGVWITYQGNSITIDGHIKIVLHKSRDRKIQRINSVTIPSLSSRPVTGIGENTQVIFTYSHFPWLLQKIQYPTGMMNTFLYNNESHHAGAAGRGLLIGRHGMTVPVVTEQIVDSGFSLHDSAPAQHIFYRYGSGLSEQHNYMGYQEYGNLEYGKDNLFDRPSNYTYQVTRDDGLISTTMTYNKYHLLIKEEQRDNQTHALLTQRNQDYPGTWKQTTFSELPPEYSLANHINQTFYSLADTPAPDNSTAFSTQIIQNRRYDQRGQIIWQQDASGRERFIQYCPPEGDRHCPPTDKNWPQTGEVEKMIMVPAKESAGMEAKMHSEQAQPMEIVFDYQRIPVIETYQEKRPAHQQISPVYFTQVKRKTTGTPDINKPSASWTGNILPDIPDKNRLSQTDYQYSTDRNHADYGQLRHSTLKKFTPAFTMIHGKRIIFEGADTTYTAKDGTIAGNKITFNTETTFDLNNRTRTVTTSANTHESSDHPESLYKDSQYISDIVTYSLDTGDKIREQDTLKEATTQFTYDHWRRLSSKTVRIRSGGKPHTTTWVYRVTPEENTTVTTTFDGQQKKTAHTSGGNILSVWHRFADQAHQPLSDQNSWIPDEQNTWTAFNKISTHTVWHAGDAEADNLPGKPVHLTTSYGYDSFNRPTWVQHPDGRIEVTVHDDAHLRIIHYQIAPVDNTSTKTSTNSHEPGPFLIVQQSNILGKATNSYLIPLSPDAEKNNVAIYSAEMKKKLTHIIAQLQSKKILLPKNNMGPLPVSGTGGLIAFVNNAISQHAWLTHSRIDYNGNGLKTRQINNNSSMTQWYYSNNHLVAIRGPDGRIIHDEFDVQGKKKLRCIQPANRHACHIMGTRGYDARGNILWQQDTHGQTLHYLYDADGRKISMTTAPTADAPAGHIFTYHYNSIGKTGEDMDGIPYVKYRYDPDSWQLTDQFDSVGHTHFKYDKNNGLLLQVTHSPPDPQQGIPIAAGIHYPAWSQNTLYDRYLSPVKIRDASGNIHTDTHDNSGRVLDSYVQPGPHRLPQLLSSHTYDNWGRVATATNGIGIKRKFIYNREGKLYKTIDSRDNKSLNILSYTYDQDTGNIITFTRQNNNDSATQIYRYDKSMNNLLSMTCSKKDETDRPGRLCPRDTDFKNSSFTAPPVITSQKYTFDEWNNIRTVTENLVSTDNYTTKSVKITNYTHETGSNENNTGSYDPYRLTAYQTRWQNQYRNQYYSATPENIMYDEAGRIIQDAKGNRLHYDVFGHQDRFTSGNTGKSIKYTYNSDGRQIAEQPFDQTGQPEQAPLYFFYNGNTLSGKAQEDRNGLLHIASELNSSARSIDGHITLWYEHDYKGDIIGLFNNQAQLIATNVYSPYGMHYDIQSRYDAQTASPDPSARQSSWLYQNDLGFNGQREDPATGYQFSGCSERAYNPLYRRFMSRDSWSPFRLIDGYGFGANNPVMNTDPTGHLPAWLGYTLGIISIPVTIVSSVLAPVALAAAGASKLTVGIATVAGVTSAFIGAAAGSLRISNTANPGSGTMLRTGDGIDIISNMAEIALFGTATSTSVRSLFSAGEIIAHKIVTKSMVVVTGINGLLTNGTNIAGDSTDIRVINNPTDSSRLRARERIGYASLGLSITTLISGMTAGMVTKRFRTAMKQIFGRPTQHRYNISAFRDESGEMRVQIEPRRSALQSTSSNVTDINPLTGTTTAEGRAERVNSPATGRLAPARHSSTPELPTPMLSPSQSEQYEAPPVQHEPPEPDAPDFAISPAGTYATDV